MVRNILPVIWSRWHLWQKYSCNVTFGQHTSKLVRSVSPTVPVIKVAHLIEQDRGTCSIINCITAMERNDSNTESS